ncbi:hypothetical protein LPB142_07815 [Rhodobacter xanthinilyticus]|uniref:ATPase n=1 Tax=Rhodobacter xanthinilyticus TaxID=1850250 RepID=A0A1D9MBL7_9RHOB|nr:FoF1 ATP synthase subunit gamma [Rhodobacter xanthinilyticus]AOZ69237.1 hypothetical protein LPB142_07815 [Rhodobacter xanthinilyticus]
MSDAAARPDDIKAHLANVQQIAAIVGALRALAAAHQREARGHLAAVRAHGASLGAALSTALGAGGVWPEAGAAQGRLSILIGAAQGFCGSHADRLAEAARAEAAAGADLIVLGSRSCAALAEIRAPLWQAEMATHAAQVPELASRLADALFEALAARPGLRVRLVYIDPGAGGAGPALLTPSLWPLEPSRFPPARGPGPLLSLPLPELIADLIEEYVFSALCEALMLGFASENAARAEAMAGAQANIKRIAADLRAGWQRARQEQMTTELIELASGAAR